MINRDQYKRVPEGQKFYWISRKGDMVPVVMTNPYSIEVPANMVGTIVRAPNGNWVSSIQVHNKWKHRFIWRSGRTAMDAKCAAWGEWIKEKEFESKMNNPRFELEYLKNTLDEYGEMSDDFRIAGATMAKRKRIKELEDEIG